MTYDSGPQVINRYVSDDAKQQFLKPGYRSRIIKYVEIYIPVDEIAC
jgi:hypothetical protein